MRVTNIIRRLCCQPPGSDDEKIGSGSGVGGGSEFRRRRDSGEAAGIRRRVHVLLVLATSRTAREKLYCVNLHTNKSPFTRHPHHHQNAGRPAGTLASPRSQGSGTSATGAGKCRLRGCKGGRERAAPPPHCRGAWQTKLSPKAVVQLPRVSDVLTASETVHNRTLHGFHMPGTVRVALQHGHATAPRKLWASRPSSPRRRIPVVTLYHS